MLQGTTLEVKRQLSKLKFSEQITENSAPFPSREEK